MARPQILSLPERLDTHHRFGGRGITIGFVDAGFFAHPDLMRPRSRVKAYIDVFQDPPPKRDFFEAKPSLWHGTMTACVGAGNGYLSGGRYRSLAPESSVVLLKATDVKGRISGEGIARAIRYPLRHPELGVRVLSVSLGVGRDDPFAKEIEAAVSEATRAGILVVVAAGNDPSALPAPPASAVDALTVGGIDDGNTRWLDDDVPWPSTHGAGTKGVPKPDVVSLATQLPAPMLPGTLVAREAPPLFELLGILDELAVEELLHGSASSEEERAKTPEQRSLLALAAALEGRLAARKYVSTCYQHVDGTSFAAPITASVAAQMLEANPSLTVAQLRLGITSTAVSLAKVPPAVQGAGSVCPRAAVEWAIARGRSME